MARYAETSVGNRSVFIEIDPGGEGITSMGSLAEWAEGVAAVTETIGRAVERAGRAGFEFGVSVTPSGELLLIAPERAALRVQIPAPVPSPEDLTLPTVKPTGRGSTS